MKPSGVVGMAVMEGVMMKNKDEYAVAVRKPNNEIVVEKSTRKDFSDKVKLFKLPIFRGMLAFVDSMLIGVKVLNYSASFFEEEEAQAKKSKRSDKKDPIKIKNYDEDFKIEDLSLEEIDAVNDEILATKEITDEDEHKGEKTNPLLMILAVVFSIILTVALFMVLPVLITNFLSTFISNQAVIAFIEGIIRLSIVIGYAILATRMPEIKRVLMYHGAEHKTINCLEHGFELTVENVRWQSKLHKCCGTSFMLLVILISIIFFMLIPINDLFWRVISRIVLIPIIAGVSYEFIRLVGKSESKALDILSLPSLWMQGLTTKEPDDEMIEVAIASVGSVFDWKEKTSKKTEEIDKTEVKSSKVEEKPTKSIKTAEKSGKTADKKRKTEEKKSMVAKQAEKTVKETEKAVAKPIVSPSNMEDEEDDEILRALDKFFDQKAKDA